MTARQGLMVAAGLGVAALVIVVPFFTATTFVGDDHLFLTFAREAPRPLVAFVRDQHGGEFYRPVPMLLWWGLARLAGGSPVPFAALGLGLHLGAAGLLGALLVALGRPGRVAVLAGALFLIAPQNLDAAYWYAASTDLLATALCLGALVALVRARPVVSASLAAASYLCKESALILPGLAFVVLGAAAEPSPDRWRRARLVLPHAALALAVLGVRRIVLGGWGGGGDEAASWPGKALQLASGLVHVGPGAEVLPELASWVIGGAIVAVVFGTAFRRGRGTREGASEARGRGGAAPALFTTVALLPLLAARWPVGARYFYLPAVGLAWGAGEGLADAGAATRAVVLGLLAALGAVQAGARQRDVAAYEKKLGAARRAVAAGLREGHRVFHISGGIKDLDLAVKDAPAASPATAGALVLSDVPASFVMLPPDLEAAASILVAEPPLPPSGAYRFGARRVVGLARRGDDPSLDEVIARFPDIRFIRLRPAAGGVVVARDVTDDVKGSEGSDAQSP
jgi:hypothetical protein